MSDKNKIQQEELEKIQALVQSIREAEGNFFKASAQLLEMQKVQSDSFSAMQAGNAQLQSEMQALKEVYGDIVINLENGEYEDAPKQEEAAAPELTVIKPE
jgi:hypothetical protein